MAKRKIEVGDWITVQVPVRSTKKKMPRPAAANTANTIREIFSQRRIALRLSTA